MGLRVVNGGSVSSGAATFSPAGCTIGDTPFMALRDVFALVPNSRSVVGPLRVHPRSHAPLPRSMAVHALTQYDLSRGLPLRRHIDGKQRMPRNDSCSGAFYEVLQPARVAPLSLLGLPLRRRRLQ